MAIPTSSSLGEVLEICDSGCWGDAGDQGDFPVLRSSNIQDGRLTLDDVAYRKVRAKDVSRCLLADGDILVTKSSGSAHLIGKVCRFIPPDSRNYLFSNFTQRLRVLPQIIDSRFLYYYLESPNARTYLQKISNTTSGLRNLNIGDYLQQRVPLPELRIQKQIAAILEKADAAGQKRREANNLTNQFLQSLFLEMFGDPVRNEKGWKVENIGNTTISHDHRRVPIESSLRASRRGKYPYYGASGIIDSIDDFIFDFPALLIGEDGANLVARSSPVAFIATGKYWVNNHAHVLTPLNHLTAEYLEYFFNHIDLKPYVSGSAQPKLTAFNLAKIRIPVPSAEALKAFSKVVQNVEDLKHRQVDSETELENLFNSLMQRAFKGELIS